VLRRFNPRDIGNSTCRRASNGGQGGISATECMARRPQQEGNQITGRGAGCARPSQTGNGADLDIFGSLGVSLGVVLEGVSGFARSAAELLPISEEHGQGKTPVAHSSSNASCAPSRQVSSRTHAYLRARTKSDSTLSEDSPRTSARSKASTKSQGMGGLARFGEAAESLETGRLSGERRRRGSSSSLDVSGAQRAAVEHRMCESLPSAKDGLRVPKPRDPCDKATHSKISSWMSKAEPAPPPPPPPAEGGGGLMLFNKLAGLGVVLQ
jgi:hypothetical protein